MSPRVTILRHVDRADSTLYNGVSSYKRKGYIVSKAQSKGLIIFEAFLVDIFSTILNFLTAWVIMLLWGAFVSESGFNLPTLGYWTVFFGALVVQQVASLVFYPVNLRLAKIEQNLKVD